MTRLPLSAYAGIAMTFLSVLFFLGLWPADMYPYDNVVEFMYGLVLAQAPLILPIISVALGIKNLQDGKKSRNRAQLTIAYIILTIAVLAIIVPTLLVFSLIDWSDQF